MRDPRHEEFERLKRRAIELGNTGRTEDYRELIDFLKSEFPIVRKAAASALVKLLDRSPSAAPVCKVALVLAIEKESGEQTLQFMLRAVARCAASFNALDFDILRDVARNPTHKEYVRAAASEAIALGELKTRDRQARRGHECARCRKILSVEEAKRGLDTYGKPYCHHCLEEKLHEDVVFASNVEAAKRLRTTDGVAVQSQGEKRIGSWLAAKAIAYEYDERMIVAGGIRIRPDFYLPEFDVYIEYWGMNTPEYVENMRQKKILYKREGKRLVSLSYMDLPKLEEVLELKLSRYVRI